MALDHSNQTKWGLRGVNFTLGEIAAVTTVGRICGSIMNRPQYAGLFDAAQSKFNLTTQNPPVWLRDIEFVRSAVILGEGMRRIHVPNTMADVDKTKLSGLATFVVLCSQFSEDMSSITKMLNLLLIGGLGTVVQVPDVTDRPNLPYGFRPHITAFITSCLDANRNSDVYRNTLKSMSELHMFGDVSGSINNKQVAYSARRRQASIDLMGELLGELSVEETMSKSVREVFQIPEKKPLDGWARIHDTLHLTSAYIALAAAANGANVVVECISDRGSKLFPAPIQDPEARRTTFLVRLWLVQPPEHIRGFLRYSNSDHDTLSWQDPKQDRDGGDPDGSRPVIFGGALEIALCVARSVGFRGHIGSETANGDENLEILALWSRAVECAKDYRWSPRGIPNIGTWGYYLASFELQRPKELPFPPQALSLHDCLVASDRETRPVARTVANLVHGYYLFNDYTSLLKAPDETGSQIEKAMNFVLLAMAIQSLQNTISPASDSPEIYALNTGALKYSFASSRLLKDLILRAFSPNGVSSLHVLHAAASVWGGLSPSAAQTSGGSGGEALGIVAPHCCVIFDLLRDPLGFTRGGRSSVESGLLSIWRGALPMLPRNPSSNLVQGYAEPLPGTYEAGSQGQSLSYSSLDGDYTPTSEYPQDSRPFGNMVITFEPCHQEPSRVVFCAWFAGHCVAEIDPSQILAGVLCSPSRPFQDLHSGDIKLREGVPEMKVIDLYKMDLLSLGKFKISDKVVAIIRDMDDPAWVIFGIGCCYPLNNGLAMHDRSTEGEFEWTEFADELGGMVGFVMERNFG